jgi:UTP--glucose-1-phosphate uridylyltransferase
VRIRTAVIPAAGLGTRFLPVTKAVPKELIPLVDTPGLQLVIEEAFAAGIERVVVVSSKSKDAVERYVAPDAEIDQIMTDKGMAGARDRLRALTAPGVVQFAYQDEPRGLGHAVGCARDLVGDEPFAVLLPDELMGDARFLRSLVEGCEATGGCVVGLQEVPVDQVSRYGVIAPAGPADPGGRIPVADLVEKPPADRAPSNLVIVGRYALTAEVFDEIEQLTPGAGGELQLTDALRALALAGRPFHGVVGDVERHDTGNPLGMLKAAVSLGLRHPELGPDLRSFLAGLVSPRAAQ